MNTVYPESETPAIARDLLAEIDPQTHAATVIGLSGDLGAGKTTLVQSVAALLGVSEPVVSPTFVIAKFYETKDCRWQTLVHMDAYRIEDAAELGPLGWDALLADPRALVIVEWPERIAQKLPVHAAHFTISHHDRVRHIQKTQSI